MKPCNLAFENGMVFRGQLLGAPGTASGEAVFNTAMTGYQEVLTDPSYYGQIVTMTYPLIGNYGVNTTDIESADNYLSGYVVKELPQEHGNQLATQSLGAYLKEKNLVGMCGVDTRAITRQLRSHGVMRAIISSEIMDDHVLIKKAGQLPHMSGQNLARKVAGEAVEQWPATGNSSASLVVVLDCGVKYNIIRRLEKSGCGIKILNGLCDPRQVLECNPDGVLVGNGPGDPAVVEETILLLRKIIGLVPIMGICLGHQMLACALGADIYKLKFGHHGVNHPVKRLATDRIEITSQNHGFAVCEDSLPRAGCHATHINLNDQSIEGFAHKSEPLFAVQYHPEAAPGPHDSSYVFDLFTEMVTRKQVPASLIPV